MIVCGKDTQHISTPKSSEALPDANHGAMKYARAIKIIINETSMVDGKQEIVSRETLTRATVQPMKPQEIAMYPEGNRQWRWMTFHMNYANLAIEDGFKWKGILFKVMGKSDFSDYGYYKYDCCEDYTDDANG